MKTTRLFKSVMRKIMMGSCVAVMTTGGAYGTTEVDPIVQEAQLKANEGDLEEATRLYHKAMRQDSENTEIRRALAKVLVEASVREPHAETEPEVIEIIEKGTKAIVD